MRCMYMYAESDCCPGEDMGVIFFCFGVVLLRCRWVGMMESSRYI